MANDSKIKGVMTGVVVSDKADMTRVVEVRSRKQHPKYKKIYTVTKKFVVHDGDNATHAGDKVSFVPSRPYSKTKKFVIIGKA